MFLRLLRLLWQASRGTCPWKKPSGACNSDPHGTRNCNRISYIFIQSLLSSKSLEQLVLTLEPPEALAQVIVRPEMQALKGEALLRHQNKQKGSRNQHLQPPPMTLQALLAYSENLSLHIWFFHKSFFLVCSDTSVTCVQFPPCLAVFRLFLWRCDQFPPPCVAWCNRPCQFRESLITWWEIYETWFADDWHWIYEMLRQDIKNRKARVSWRIQRIGCCDSWHIVWKYLEASASSIWLPIFITDPVGFVKINTSVCSCR